MPFKAANTRFASDKKLAPTACQLGNHKIKSIINLTDDSSDAFR
jgi:hypothetical protein